MIANKQNFYFNDNATDCSDCNVSEQSFAKYLVAQPLDPRQNFQNSRPSPFALTKAINTIANGTPNNVLKLLRTNHLTLPKAFYDVKIEICVLTLKCNLLIQNTANRSTTFDKHMSSVPRCRVSEALLTNHLNLNKTPTKTRWLLCVECPQYRIRLEAVRYLCTSCLLPAFVKIICYQNKHKTPMRKVWNMIYKIQEKNVKQPIKHM